MSENLSASEMQRVAPPPPPCFDDREAWADYLHECQKGGKRPTARPIYIKARRPELVAVYRTTFNFCTDCDAAHADAMQAAGRCRPRHFHEQSA